MAVERVGVLREPCRGLLLSVFSRPGCRLWDHPAVPDGHLWSSRTEGQGCNPLEAKSPSVMVGASHGQMGWGRLMGRWGGGHPGGEWTVSTPPICSGLDSVLCTGSPFLPGPHRLPYRYSEPHPPKVGESVTRSVVSDSLQPHGLQPARLLCPWGSPGKNTGVGCHSLLQGVFLTQGLNLGLLHYRQILYHLSHQGRPLKDPQAVKSSIFFFFCYGEPLKTELERSDLVIINFSKRQVTKLFLFPSTKMAKRKLDPKYNP